MKWNTRAGSGARFEDLADPRWRLMLDMARDILERDGELTLCEGLRIIEATRMAIARTAPGSLGVFDERIRPHLRSALLERFGIAAQASAQVN